MVSSGTADNMKAAVQRLTEPPTPIRPRVTDPFAPVGHNGDNGHGLAEDARAYTGAAAPTGRNGNGAARRTAGASTDARSRQTQAKRAAVRNARKRRPARAARRRKDSPGTIKLKKLAAPVLLLLAVGLIIPGVWSVLVFAGAEVPMSDHDSATAMAAMMLVCWPLAACLGFVGGLMIRDVVQQDDAA